MEAREVLEAHGDEGERHEEPTDASLLMPLRFLGMGLFIAWLCCTHLTLVFPGAGYSLDLRNAFDTGMRLGDIATFLLLAILATRVGNLAVRPKLCTVLVALTAAGTLLVGLVLIPAGLPSEVVLAVSVPVAAGGSVLFCLWAQAYSQMGMARAVVYGALSCIAAGAVSFLVGTMKQPYAVIITGLLPLFSYACAFLSFRLLPAEPAPRSGERYALPWKLIAIMTVAGFLSGASGSGLPQAEGIGSMLRVASTALAGLVLLALFRFARDRADVRILAKTAAALAVVAVVLVPLVEPAAALVEAFLLKLSYVWFTLFVLLVLSRICYRFEVPTLRVFAVARACSEAAIFVGIMLRRGFRASGLAESEPFLIGFAVCGLVLIAACVLVWTSEKSVNGDWGAAGVSLEGGVHVPTARERFVERRDTLAAEHGLTPRETEIMSLVAEGKTRRQIEQELFLSENTVKTHVRHIHSKLGTKSKEDIQALFGDGGR
ncbi:helix-turn-helix transcriptional regulator [Adlercreutzia equolifaciens]|uniref:helix-turn-helix transcriptional regulator n=1 Tax=Adlercreutzia equolifaciens TaxID=446660 RepID=UPI0023AF8711|nr:helix-turn-helix transcriptional regulator [Adlercreutzia equolifaciens]MDE8701829.1 helix-turn-helix transcriptional regulator [Adlercreutzia equolifaciens]